MRHCRSAGSRPSAEVRLFVSPRRTIRHPNAAEPNGISPSLYPRPPPPRHRFPPSCLLGVASAQHQRTSRGPIVLANSVHPPPKNSPVRPHPLCPQSRLTNFDPDQPSSSIRAKFWPMPNLDWRSMIQERTAGQCVQIIHRPHSKSSTCKPVPSVECETRLVKRGMQHDQC
ncbi:hypothetical protein BC567DRAFT_215147 [Phyllosticta citribraziliensis]